MFLVFTRKCFVLLTEINTVLFLVVVVVVVVADACECGNEPSGSVKCGEFLD